MAYEVFETGATDKTITVRAYIDTTFLPKTGLVFNAAGLTAYYREGATGAATALTLATQTVGGVFSAGGFVEIDATNMPGEYRLDLSDAMLDSGAGSRVTVHLKGTNTVFEPVTILLTADDPAAAGVTAAQIADAVHDEPLAGHVAVGSAGKALADIEVDAAAAASEATTAASTAATINTKIGTPVGADLVADIAAIDTDVTTLTGGVTLAAGAVTAAAIAADAITAAKVAPDVHAEMVTTLLATTIDGLSVADYLSAAGSFNVTIAAGVLTVKDLAGNTIYTRTLTLGARDAINNATP